MGFFSTTRHLPFLVHVRLEVVKVYVNSNFPSCFFAANLLIFVFSPLLLALCCSSLKNKRVRKPKMKHITGHDSFRREKLFTDQGFFRELQLHVNVLVLLLPPKWIKVRLHHAPLLLYPTLRKKITQVDKLSLERRKEARNDKIVFS